MKNKRAIERAILKSLHRNGIHPAPSVKPHHKPHHTQMRQSPNGISDISLGMAFVKALNENQRELRRRGISLMTPERILTIGRLEVDNEVRLFLPPIPRPKKGVEIGE